MKRFSFFSLCIALVLSFVLCGGISGPDAADAGDSLFNETGYPIFNELVTMKVLFPRQAQHPTDFSNMWWVKEVQEKFNINRQEVALIYMKEKL